MLKEKCLQLNEQVGYLKEALAQKDHTLVDLCRSREDAKDQFTGLREVSSIKQ